MIGGGGKGGALVGEGGAAVDESSMVAAGEAGAEEVAETDADAGADDRGSTVMSMVTVAPAPVPRRRRRSR